MTPSTMQSLMPLVIWFAGFLAGWGFGVLLEHEIQKRRSGDQ